MEEVRQLYIDLCQASIDKNIDRLREILDEDYVLVHMTGMRQSKSEYINSIKNGELKYYDLVHEDIEVSIDEEHAKVIGKTNTLASPFGITKSWWRLKQELTMKKVNGKWKIVKSVASTY